LAWCAPATPIWRSMSTIPGRPARARGHALDLAERWLGPGPRADQPAQDRVLAGLRGTGDEHVVTVCAYGQPEVERAERLRLTDDLVARLELGRGRKRQRRGVTWREQRGRGIGFMRSRQLPRSLAGRGVHA